MNKNTQKTTKKEQLNLKLKLPNIIYIFIVILFFGTVFYFVFPNALSNIIEDLSRLKTIFREPLWSEKFIEPGKFFDELPKIPNIKEELSNIFSITRLYNIFLKYLPLFAPIITLFLYLYSILNAYNFRKVNKYRLSIPLRIYLKIKLIVVIIFKSILKPIKKAFNYLTNKGIEYKKTYKYILVLFLIYSGAFSTVLVEAINVFLKSLSWNYDPLYLWGSQILALIYLCIKYIKIWMIILALVILYPLLAFKFAKKKKKKNNLKIIEILKEIGVGLFVNGPVKIGKTMLITALSIGNYRLVIQTAKEIIKETERRFYKKIDFKKVHEDYMNQQIINIVDVWDFTDKIIKIHNLNGNYKYNDFKGKLKLRDELCLYITCLYIIDNKSYIVSNYNYKYRDTVSKTKDSKYMMTRVIDFDGIRTNKLEERIDWVQDGITISLQEFDKEADSDNKSFVLAQGLHSFMSMVRHFTSLGYRSLGKIIADTQIATKIARIVRGNFEQTFNIKKTKTKIFWMLRPFLFITDRLLMKCERKKDKWKNRVDDFLLYRINEFKLHYLQRFKDYLESYVYISYKIDILESLNATKEKSENSSRTGKVRLNLNVDELHGAYDSTQYKAPHNKRIRNSLKKFDDLIIADDIKMTIKEAYSQKSYALDMQFENLYELEGLEKRDWNKFNKGKNNKKNKEE